MVSAHSIFEAGKDMLILTRKAGERIHLGDDIWVQILDVRGNTVRIGVEAPKHVEVHRAEIYWRIQAERTGGPGQRAGG